VIWGYITIKGEIVGDGDLDKGLIVIWRYITIKEEIVQGL
jgi:hypothetical protein